MNPTELSRTAINLVANAYERFVAIESEFQASTG